MQRHSFRCHGWGWKRQRNHSSERFGLQPKITWLCLLVSRARQGYSRGSLSGGSAEGSKSVGMVIDSSLARNRANIAYATSRWFRLSPQVQATCRTVEFDSSAARNDCPMALCSQLNLVLHISSCGLQREGGKLPRVEAGSKIPTPVADASCSLCMLDGGDVVPLITPDYPSFRNSLRPPRVSCSNVRLDSIRISVSRKRPPKRKGVRLYIIMSSI